MHVSGIFPPGRSTRSISRSPACHAGMWWVTLFHRHHVETTVLERQVGGVGKQEHGVAPSMCRPSSLFNLTAVEVNASDVQPIGIRNSTRRLAIAAADIQIQPPGFDGHVPKPSDGPLGHAPAVTGAVKQGPSTPLIFMSNASRETCQAMRRRSESALNRHRRCHCRILTPTVCR